MDFSKIIFTVNNTQVKVASSASYTSDKRFENMIPAYSQTLGQPVSLSYVKYMDRYSISMEDIRSDAAKRRAHQRRLLRLKRKLKFLVA